MSKLFRQLQEGADLNTGVLQDETLDLVAVGKAKLHFFLFFYNVKNKFPTYPLIKLKVGQLCSSDLLDRPPKLFFRK